MTDSGSVDMLAVVVPIQSTSATATSVIETDKQQKSSKKRKAQEAALSSASISEDENEEFARDSIYYLQLAVDNLKNAMKLEYNHANQ